MLKKMIKDSIKNINFVMILCFICIFSIILSNKHTVIDKFLLSITLLAYYVVGYMFASCLAGLVMSCNRSHPIREYCPKIIPKLQNLDEVFENYHEYPEAVNVRFYYKKDIPKKDIQIITKNEDETNVTIYYKQHITRKDVPIFMKVKNVIGEIIYSKDNYNQENFIEDYNKWLNKKINKGG